MKFALIIIDTIEDTISRVVELEHDYRTPNFPTWLESNYNLSSKDWKDLRDYKRITCKHVNGIEYNLHLSRVDQP